MDVQPPYAGFIGTWILDPSTCDYEQGAPPRTGRYQIVDRGGELHFTMEWTDQQGVDHRAGFSGVPDGMPRPFAGGDLADALSITAVSPRELTSAALYRGVERMFAQRQLDDTLQAMRVTQLIRLPNGSRPANIAVYRRLLPN